MQILQSDEDDNTADEDHLLNGYNFLICLYSQTKSKYISDAHYII